MPERGQTETELGIMRNAEFVMHNQERRDSAAYRRAQISAALRACKTLIQKRDKYGVTAAPALIYGGRGQ